MRKLSGAFILGVCLLTPLATLQAQSHHDESHHWSEGENTYWHQYLKEHHKKDHDWAHAKKREQTDYWKWREQHRDH